MHMDKTIKSPLSNPSLPENRNLLSMGGSHVKYSQREVLEPRYRKIHPYLFAGIRATDRERILLQMDLINDYSDVEVDHYTAVDELPAERLLAIVAQATGLSHSTVLATCRKRECVNARFIFAHFLKYVNRYTFQKIADTLGYTNHTTVIHGIDVLMDKIKKDPELRAQFLRAQDLVGLELRNRRRALMIAEQIVGSEGNGE